MARRSTTLLRTLAPAIKRELSQTMYAAGDIVRVAAQISITTGAVSGKNHVASRPGEPPNQDTAVLGNNIVVRQLSALRVEIAATAPYSSDLELGTSRMAARPFMSPAANASRAAVTKKLDAAVRRATRKHMRS